MPADRAEALRQSSASSTRQHGSRDFETLQLFPERLRDLRKFSRLAARTGHLYPKMVFVNSLSDFWHADGTPVRA